MDYEYYEKAVTSYVILYPGKSDFVDLSLIKNDYFSSVISFIKSKKGMVNDSFSIVNLQAALSDSVPKFCFTQLHQEVQEMKDNGKEYCEREFNLSLGQLRERQRKEEILFDLNYAIDCINEGKYKEGVVVAHSIKFQNNVRLPDTFSMMKSSNLTTNKVKCGIPMIDDYSGFELGTLMGLIGDSGGQKTRFTLWLCLKILANNPEFNCLYFEKEMRPEKVFQHMVRYFTGFSRLNDSAFDMLNNLTSHDQTIKNIINRMKIVPSSYFNSAFDMYEYIDSNPCNIWCLDFMTLLSEEGRKKGKRRSEDFYGDITSQMEILKEMSLTTNTFGIIIGQMKHGAMKAFKGRMPDIDEAEYGSKLKQFSANIYGTFPPHKYDEIKSYVNKSWFFLTHIKNREGELKDIPLLASPETLHYRVPEKRDEEEMMAWLNNYKIQRK